MPSLKEYNVKINSLTNTAKVTKTMNMVSISKYRKAQQAQVNSSLYAKYLNASMDRLVEAVGEEAFHPLMSAKEGSKNNALLIVCASDRGLCGGFNNNLFRYLNQWFGENKSKYDEIDFISSSKRSTSATQKLGKVLKSYEDISGNPSFDIAHEIGQFSQKTFLEGNYRQVFIVYNIFESALVQTPTLKQILPLVSLKKDDDNQKQESKVNLDYIYQPSKNDLLNLLIPKTINFHILNALLESAAGEHVARMTAMDSATTNAKKIIETYTIKRNRARQAQITTELTEIVAGAESLN